MTHEQLFDLIAPIAIYHGTDVCFKAKALKAVRVLWKQPDAFSFPMPSDDLDELGIWAIDCYDEIFVKLMEQEEPSWDWHFDKWGSKEYRDADGQAVFSGDAAYRFPWFETAALLKERILYHYRCQVVS